MCRVSTILVAILASPWTTSICTADSHAVQWHPGHYVTPNRSYLKMAHDRRVEETAEKLIASLPPTIVGVKGGAYWRNLETSEGVYDFTVIEKQLAMCARHHKYFLCAISERHFNPVEKPVPDYLYEPKYRGVATFPIPQCGVRGSIARIWDPTVLDRFNRLVAELGKRFSREPFFEGIVFVETALNRGPSMTDLTLDSYVNALKSRLIHAKKAFPYSVVLQETNWLINGLPSNKQSMADLVRFCHDIGAGISGPDLIPDRQRDPARPRCLAYEFYPQFAGRMPLGCNIEDPEYMGKVGSMHLGQLTPEGIYQMGMDTLKLNYFFWSLRDKPGDNFTFSGDVLPLLKKMEGKVHTTRPENLRHSKRWEDLGREDLGSEKTPVKTGKE